MVVEQVQNLGLEVMLSKRVKKINTDDHNNVIGVIFEDEGSMDCSCICFAIGIQARDALARESGIECNDRIGGITVDEKLSTSAKDVYAIGECASFNNQTYGLIAPGIEMADVLAFNLTQAKVHSERKFKRPDMSTKLKLLGVNVASFGDFFADRDGPKNLPQRRHGTKPSRKKSKSGDGKHEENDSQSPPVKALTFKDPFEQVYKKYIFTEDGKYLLGGMMVRKVQPISTILTSSTPTFRHAYRNKSSLLTLLAWHLGWRYEGLCQALTNSQQSEAT